MSFETIQKELTAKSKILLKFIDTNEKANTYDQIKIRSEFSDDELQKCLAELNDKFVVTTARASYQDEPLYLLILNDEEIQQMEKFYKKQASKSVTHTISFSRLDVLKNSERRFFFKYIKRIKPAEEKSFALIFGSFVHNLIENIFDKSIADIQDFINNRVQNMIQEFPDDMQENMGVRFFELIPNLLQIKDRFTVIELEKHINVPIMDVSDNESLCQILTALTPKKYRKEDGLTDKIGFNGYIDAWLQEISTGLKWVVDWKTGTMNATKHRKNTRQIQVYAYLLRLIGEKPDKGAVAYIEQQMENNENKMVPKIVEVDISVDKCEKVFTKMLDDYVEKISQGITFDKFYRCCSRTKKIWCQYARMCDVINNVRVDSSLLRQTILLQLNQ